jgi:hypothetical protein
MRTSRYGNPSNKSLATLFGFHSVMETMNESSRIERMIMDGTPGRRICHARGLCQGDPLLPLLSVLTVEALNALLQLAEEKQLLTSLRSPLLRHRASLHADDLDLVLFLSLTVQDLKSCKNDYGHFRCRFRSPYKHPKCQFTPIYSVFGRSSGRGAATLPLPTC